MMAKQKYTHSKIKDLTIQLECFHLNTITSGSFTLDGSEVWFNSLDKDVKNKLYKKTIRLIKSIDDLNAIVKIEYEGIKDLLGKPFKSLSEDSKNKAYKEAKEIQSIITKFLERKAS